MNSNQEEKRRNEKGAAMVMVLLISLLLLTASAGLLMESSMNTQNVSDATAEQQAYNAAESGLQATINVLRGNVIPNPLIDATKADKHPSNLISFRKAISASTSNNNADAVPRLSRWLNYTYKTGGSAFNDRVVIGTAGATYDPHTGYAYTVSLSDPDKTGEIIEFSADGQFRGFDADNKEIWQNLYTRNVGAAAVVVRYDPVTTPVRLDVSTGNRDTEFGKFKLEITPGTGALTMTEDIRFRILIKLSAPYGVKDYMRGWIRTKDKDLRTVGTVDVEFDSPASNLSGSLFSLKPSSMPLKLPVTNPLTGQMTPIQGDVSPAEPFRLLVKSIGYGPRGAKKELEAIVQKDFFNGLSAPATLTLIGGETGFEFTPGNSTPVAYSGDDVSSIVNIPSIGTTNAGNLKTIDAVLAAKNVKTVPDPPAENILDEVPFWLESPKNLDATIKSLRAVADSSGRLFKNGSVPGNSDFGNYATATGITFVEGDADLKGSGGGILVCTGKLTLNGAFDFKGLIIVTGEGGIDRKGTGNGNLLGNVVIAPYNPNNLNAGFLSPKYDTSGGGNSLIRFDSNSVANGMTAVSNFVLGVAEK